MLLLVIVPFLLVILHSLILRKEKSVDGMALSEGEGECLDAQSEKFDPEGTIAHCAFLPDQLIEAAFGHHAEAVCVAVHAAIGARRFSIERNAEADWPSVAARRKNEVKVAGMKAINDASGGREQRSNLAL